MARYLNCYKSPWYPTPNIHDQALFDRYWQQWREKGRTEIVAAVNTQPEPLDEESDPWHPPRDVHDQAAWDRYWQHRQDLKRFRYEYCPATFLRSRGDRLTERQQEVQQLLAEGKSANEIASVLNLTFVAVALDEYRIMEALHPRAQDSPF